MRCTRICAISLLHAAGLLSAQGGVPPRLLTPFGPDPVFSQPALPGTAQLQIHLAPFPGRPGLFLAALTTRGLPAAHGGVGGLDLLTGTYDALARAFTPDPFAAGLNTRADEFGLSLHASGLLAAYETKINSVYGVQIAGRPDLSSPFRWIGSVTNLPANPDGYWDPALADVGGVPHLLFLRQRPSPDEKNADIAMAPLDLKSLAIGASRVIVQTPVADQKCNSPTPILDSRGELIGVSHHVTVNRNDHYLSFDLDPATPTLELIATPTWINNGGFAAGTFFDAEETVGAYRIGALEAVWWIAGPADLGGAMEVSAYCPIGKSGWFSFLLLAAAFLPAPMSVPGVGLLGLDPAGLVPPIPLGGHGPGDGTARLLLPIPRDPVLKGLSIPGQILVQDGPARRFHLGNTAALGLR